MDIDFHQSGQNSNYIHYVKQNWYMASYTRNFPLVLYMLAGCRALGGQTTSSLSTGQCDESGCITCPPSTGPVQLNCLIPPNSGQLCGTSRLP